MSKMKITNIKTGEVKIYTVGEMIFSDSRGKEYLLHENVKNCRVCEAIPEGTSYTTGGEKLEHIIEY